jgi:hypothetical protein
MADERSNGVVSAEQLEAMLAQPQEQEAEEQYTEEGGQEAQPDLFPATSRGAALADRIAAAAGAAGQLTGAGIARLGGIAGSGLEKVGGVIPSGPPDDDLSDLFEGPDMDNDNDVYIKDLVSVEEEDVFGEGGADMSDILEVSNEDVMGEEEIWNGGVGWAPSPKLQIRPRPARAAPPTGLSRMSL